MEIPTRSARSIFLEAIENHSSDDWGSFLDTVCSDSPHTHRQVEKLLRVYDPNDSFMVEPASDLVGGVLDLEFDCEVPSLVGSTIGRYTLVEEIGEGGMGTVYLASQTQPLKRMVALKIIKAGMDTREVVTRFEAERQALCLMSHPNIAKVLDCGATESGRPYIVMEFVEGLPVTEFCDEHRLSMRSRLQLLITICHAVQHAHQKGVIHRDLKPSNILVELHDSNPVPKVIDFGIAKSIGNPLTEHSHHTDMRQMLGTPMYMSPEQTAPGSVDIDTRSDVYSLGVILYELLTGRTPFEKESLRLSGEEDLRRMIREVDPPRPSVRVGALKGPAISTIAERQSVDAIRLSQRLRGELDWITMKAIEKDRGRRYESPSALAADLQRFLDDEPVFAHPPSVAYRFQKTLSKHWKPIFVATCLAMTMLVGTGVSLWQAERARIAERQSNLHLAEVKANEARTKELAWRSGIREAFTSFALGMHAEVAGILDKLEQSDLQAETRPEWHILKQELARDYRRLLGIGAPIHEVRLIPNSALVAAAGGDGNVYIVDWRSGTTIRTIETGVPSLHALAISKDGRLLATGGVTDPVTDLAAPLIFDVQNGQRVHELAGQTTTIESLEFAMDDTWIVCGSRYEDVQLIEIKSGVVEKLPASKRNLWVACSPDGTQVAVQSDLSEVYVSDMHLPSQGQRIDMSNPVIKSLWIPGTDRLVSLLSAPGALAVIEPQNNAYLVQLKGAIGAECFALRDDGAVALAGLLSGEIIAWQVPRGLLANKTVPIIQEAQRTHLANSPITSLETSADWILAGTLGGELLAARLLPMSPVGASSDKVLTQTLPSAAAWRSDGETLILGDIDGTLYETRDFDHMQVLSTGSDGSVTEVSISPDQKLIAAIRSRADSAILLDGKSERILPAVSQDPQLPTVPFNVVEFSRDSHWVAWGGKRNLMIASFDADPDAAPQSFSFPGFVDCLAWDRDGHGIYAAGRFDTLHHVDLRSGQLNTIANVGVSACTLLLSSDGSQLFSGHDDGSVRIWNLIDGSMKSMFLHRVPVRSIALSHDGRLGASADNESNIAIWFPQSAEPVGVFNQLPQWALGDRPHRPEMVFTPNDQQLRVFFRSPDNQSILRTWDLKPRDSN